MAHRRQIIRDAVVAQLLDKTSAQDRVYGTRQAAWRRVELPGLAVYAMEEEEQDRRRRLTLAVLLVVALTEQVDTALDDLSSEVESAFNADLSFGGVCLGSRYTGMVT